MLCRTRFALLPLAVSLTRQTRGTFARARYAMRFACISFCLFGALPHQDLRCCFPLTLDALFTRAHTLLASHSTVRAARLSVSHISAHRGSRLRDNMRSCVRMAPRAPRYRTAFTGLHS